MVVPARSNGCSTPCAIPVGDQGGASRGECSLADGAAGNAESAGAASLQLLRLSLVLAVAWPSVQPHAASVD